MALFKFRKGGDDVASAAPQPESVEAMRRRAKHRLMGAAVLVLAGVIGFPLLMDKQPRPVAVDIPIEIPDMSKVKPLAITVPERGGAESAPVATPKSAIAVPSAPAAVAAAKPSAIITETQAEAGVEVKPAVRPDAKSTEKQSDKAVDKTVDKAAEKAVDKISDKAAPKSAEAPPVKATPKPVDSGAKALALLEGKELPKDPAQVAAKDDAKPAAAVGERYIVQVGAFADATKAREVRLKVERAGLKTYTHVAETPEGRRIRVRVGPFAHKAEADKAADKIKKLDLPAAILTL